MWRAFFSAVGITLCILGLECFFVEKAVLAQSPDAVKTRPSTVALLQTPEPPKAIETKEWMPWSFLSLGTIVILYSVTLPKRQQDE